MSLTKLIGFIDQDNIADQIDKEQLAKIGERVKRHFDEDLGSMQPWMKGIKESRKLMKQEFHGRSTPWDNASNFKSPILAESSIAFGDKASLELLRSPELVKTDIIGKDPSGEKKVIAERISEAMNYQINYMMDWRDEQKRLFYFVPNDGTVFKKTFFDPTEQKTLSEVIQYPDFVINQATKNMKSCRSFTQILDISSDEANIRFESGLWHGKIEDIYPGDVDGDEGSNEANQTENSSDNTDRFLEQQCWADLNDDGLEEPYIITLHEETSTIVRIVARFNEKSLIVKDKETDFVTDFPQAMKLQVESFVNEVGAESIALIGLAPPKPEPEKLDLVRIEPFVNLTKYGFIPSPDGTFLDVGYSHLLGAYAQAINSQVNLLTDASTLSTMGGGFTARGFRKGKGSIKLKMGSYVPTDMSPEVLAKSIFPNPAPEPSPTLFQLNQMITERADRFGANIDQSGQIQANTAPTTALAMIQESLIPTSALMGRIIDSESKEFQILFELNQRFFDPKIYQHILDDPEAKSQQDFNTEGLDLQPTANADMASKTQRLQAAEVLMSRTDLIQQSGGNVMPIIKSWVDAVGSVPIDEIWLPEGSQLSAADQQAQDNMLQAQQQANEIEQAKLENAKILTNNLTREQDRLDAETTMKLQKSEFEIEKLIAEAQEKLASAALKGEQAETESLNNTINTYTARKQVISDSLNSIGELNNERKASQVLQLSRPENNSGSLQ